MKRRGDPKTGGRTKGTPNKVTTDVRDRLAALGCDPIEGMARIAMNRRNPVELRSRMFAELAQYVAPKRRALENPDGTPLQSAAIAFYVSGPPTLTLDQWTAAATQLRQTQQRPSPVDQLENASGALIPAPKNSS